MISEKCISETASLFSRRYPCHVSLWTTAARHFVLTAFTIVLASLAANAGTPAVTLTPSSLTFGTQLRNTTSPAQTVTLTNSGTASLSISTIKPSNGSYAATNNCGTSLAAGASCTISVTFTPQANGTVTGSILITDSASGSPQSVALTGICTIASLSPGSLNFANQAVGTTSPTQAVTLTNDGQTTLHLAAVAIQGTNPADFSQTNNCATITVGNSCTINVAFAPVVTGSLTASLNVTFTTAVSPIPVTLTGTGISAAPAATFAPTSLTFSTQPLHSTSSAQNITLSNTGGATLNITSITVGGADPADFLQTNTCGSSLAAGASCKITVQFQPTTTGTRTASVLVADNASGSPQSAGLSGTAPASVAFVQQPVSPVTVAPGGSASTLTVNGSGFASGSSVLLNGSARVTTFVNSQQLQAAILSSDVAVAGTSQVTVTNPSPGGGTSNPQSFQVTPSASTVSTSAATLGVGLDPRGIVVADFNGDGTPDMAVVDRGSNTISILLGNGNGTFGAPTTFNTGVDPIALAVGDFNGDGKLDLVTANRASYTISVLLGHGDGTFQNHVDYSAGTEPLAITVGDFNGDGFLDLAEVNSADNTVSVYLGVGDGTLQSPVVYAVGSDPIAIVPGDFNGDGILDLAIANSGSNNIAVLLGAGNGTFRNAAYYATGLDPDGLFAADLNGDGKLDLVAANNGSNSISVLLNSGNGIFAASVNYAVGSLPFAIAGGDFYGNGIIDVAVVNNGGNSVSIVPGNGDGTFNAASALTFTAGNGPIGLALGDFNLDGKPDLVITNSEDNTVSLLLQAPQANLSTTSLAFGSQMVGSSGIPQTVVLSNSGSATLSISSIAVTGTNSSQYGQTNNCASTLTAGGTCTITVTFAPTTSGTMSANLTITDSAAGSSQNVSLLGTGVAPGASLSATSLTFASQTVGTTSPAQVVTLTNTGSSALLLTSIAASGEFGESNTCGSSLPAGAACNISVTFTPSSTGTQSGTVTVADNAGNSQTVTLTGTGAAVPVAGLSPSSLSFGNQTEDTTSAVQSFTLTNSGSGPLTIVSLGTTGNYSQSNTCGTSVAAGANCTISVVFTPTAIGTLSGTVVVTDNASNSPQTVTMTGNGTTPTVTLSPTSVSFSSQALNTASAGKVIKLTNNTGTKLSISKIAASGNFSETNTCGTGGANGGSCNITVVFTPTTTGTVTGSITLTDSASGSPQTVPLSGTGVAASVLFSPGSLTFADQTVGTASSAQVVTLTNSGTASLTINGISIAGTNTGDFSQSSTCSNSIAAGASCSINVTFAPTAAGVRGASISVSDSASGSPQSVPLTGTGIAPAVGLSPASVTFSNQAVGTTSPASVVTLSNTGNAALTITGISLTGTNPGDFVQSNNCGTSLAAATSCSINVTFAPTAAGTRSATIAVSDNSTGSPQTVSLTGAGTAPAASFSATSVTFANQAVGTTSPTSGVSLFNTGNAPLTISSIAIGGTNAGDFSQGNNCGISVPAGSNCTISIQFTPAASGSRSATISVADNAAGSPQLITLAGTGTAGGPAASISPLSLTFPAQNVTSTSAVQTVTLTNSGATALNIVSIVASGDYTQTNNCGASLAAAASCSLQVTFSPSATGTRAGYITLSDNDPSTLQTVTLTGTGTAPSTTVSINPVQASVTPGQTAQFQASISGVVSSNVTWAVDGITGGNSTVGSISSTGLYTAPSAAGRHNVTATSTANTTQTASVPVIVTAYAGTFVYHNDNGRTGQNLNETVLTTGNVNANQFGKLFSYSVDGQLYGEPLYVQGVTVPGQGVHNVVYVATENDSVYAFDADGATVKPLWQVNFLTNGAQTLNTSDIGGCANISPQVGITSTPVIDPATDTMFVVARTKQVSGGATSYYQTLYALNITSGQVVQSTQIQASISAAGGTVTFNPQTENQRAGLFLNNGAVYIGWAAHCDIQPFHGWLMGYQESNLEQVAVFNATPNGSEGGIWQSGAAPAVDEYGYIYAMVGNGTFDVYSGGVDYGEGLVKLNLSGNTLAVADYFVPSNYQTLNTSDLDLGSGGPLIIPDQPTPPTQMLVAAGKQGMVYLINRSDMGEFNPNTNNVIQTLPANTVPTAHSMPAFWQNNVYFAGVGSYAQSYLLSNGLLSASPTSQSPETYGYPGATPAVSANGNANGILWALSTVQGYPALLRVYDAANLSRELYNSDLNASRDQAGMAVKFAVPTVANGKVYVGTQTELDVYGLLP